MTGAPRTLRYRPELDGLRAVAVLLVIVHHVLQPARFAGFLGVDIFFVLSGYLITSILLAEHGRRGTIRLARFYVRRLLRLYPALLAMLVLTLPAFPLMAVGGDLATAVKRAAIAATYTSNLYMTYTGNWLGPDTHTWSLALEEQYYLIWPIALIGLVRLGAPVTRRGTRVALAVLGLAFLATAIFSVRDFTVNASSFPIPSTSGGLLLGSATAILLINSRRARDVFARRWASPVSIGVFVVALVAFSATRVVPDGAYVPIATLATAVFIAHAHCTGGVDPVCRLLARRPPVALGRISYGVYLWHYPITLVCAHELAGAGTLVRLLVVTAGAIVVARASYVVVELPFLRLKNRLSETGGTPRSTAGPRGRQDAGTPPESGAAASETGSAERWKFGS